MNRSIFRSFLCSTAVCLLTACSRPPEATTELVRPVRTLIVAGGGDTGSRTVAAATLAVHELVGNCSKIF